MAYRMTGARQRALRKAQLISAQKRKRRFGFASGRKLSKGHKRALGVVAGAAIVAGGVYGTSAWMNVEQRKAKVKVMKAYRDQARWNVNARRLTRSANMSKSRGEGLDMSNTVTAPSRVVLHTKQVKTHTKLTGIAADIMRELDGKPVKGYYSSRRSGKYKVVFGERTSAQ